MAHVDALSRHVGAVVEGGTLEKEACSFTGLANSTI